MEDPLILAHDIGTSGVKSSVVSPDGTIIASAGSSHHTFCPAPTRMEQDPAEWWHGACRNTRAITTEHPDVRDRIVAIGLSGHMIGCIPVDASGTVLHNCLIHSDCRADTQCRFVAEHIGAEEIYRRSGNILDPRSTLCKILWIKDSHPEIYRRTAKFLQSKDYFVFRLTGNLDSTDFSDASHAQLLDLHTRAYNTGMLRELGIDTAKLPAVHRSTDVVGSLSPQGAEGLGLPHGIPVVAGGGDGACANAGAGVAAPGSAYCCVGSTAWIACISSDPVIDRRQRLFNIIALDGKNCGVFGTIQSAGSSLQYIMDLLGETDFSTFEKSVRTIAPGSEGLIYLPYLQGERSPIFDPKARGVYFGIQPHHGRAHFLRATIEGAAYALCSVLAVMRENAPISELRIIGGGARSACWRDILANTCDVTLKTLHASPEDATSLGAALAAGVGVGLYPDLAAATAGLAVKAEYRPDPAQTHVYSKYFPIYASLYPNLQQAYADLSAVVQEEKG
jgi:xylulokinase